MFGLAKKFVAIVGKWCRDRGEIGRSVDRAGLQMCKNVS
jgi:hypothetical protein